MKTFPRPIILAGLLLLSGCARNYVITLNNGSQVTATSKPKLQQGYYVFDDATGRPSSIAAGRVAEIAPASMTRQSSTRFGVGAD